MVAVHGTYQEMTICSFICDSDFTNFRHSMEPTLRRYLLPSLSVEQRRQVDGSQQMLVQQTAGLVCIAHK